MTQISVSQARQNLSQLLNRVFAGEEFLLVKNNIPVAHLTPVRKERVVKKRILPGATKLLAHWKGPTLDVARRLRKLAEQSNYGG